MEGLALHHSGFGWAASLEGGYPFHDESQVWEPQAQVIYQRFNDGQSSDAAATVRFDDIDSLAARLGLRWADTWKLEPAANGSPRLFTGWLRFNVWKEFKGQPTTSFSSEDGFVPFEGSIKGSWWQLNAGMTWELDKNTSFYANLGYQRGFGSKDFDAWDGKLGFRWNW
jgi:outer membrane autotransporter protein